MTDTGNLSDNYLDRDRQHLLHPLHNDALHRDHGHVWVRGEGSKLIDADGRAYIDGLSGLWNVTAGHGRQELVDAATQQMSELAYCSGYAGSTNPAAIELAERLAAITYPDINHFFFTSGGGESSDTCFKTARYYWRMLGKPEKTKVISRSFSYHGVTLAAMSATGLSAYWPMFEPRVPGFSQIASPYPYRYESDDNVSPGIAAANELEQAILQEGPDTVAMFFAEPVQGAGGVIVPPDDYFPRIREICDEYDVLLVADEVITGFGRTGKMFGLEHWGVEPDMIQFAKAITSGYFPFGGVGMSGRIVDTLNSGDAVWMHSYTYSAHPVGCRVALATLDIVESEDFVQQAADKGEYLLNQLRDALGNHPNMGDIRGLGMMAAVEYVQDKATKAAFPVEDGIGAKINLACQRRGLFSRISGTAIFCIAPPIVTSEVELKELVDIVRAATIEVLRE